MFFAGLASGTANHSADRSPSPHPDCNAPTGTRISRSSSDSITTAVGVAGGEVDVQVPVLLEVGVQRDPEQAALAQQRLVQVVDSWLLSD